MIVVPNVRKQSGAIQSYYRGFSFSGVWWIKISLCAGRFRHSWYFCRYYIISACQLLGSAPNYQFRQNIVLWGFNNIYCQIAAPVFSCGIIFQKDDLYTCMYRSISYSFNTVGTVMCQIKADILNRTITCSNPFNNVSYSCYSIDNCMCYLILSKWETISFKLLRSWMTKP